MSSLLDPRMNLLRDRLEAIKQRASKFKKEGAVLPEEILQLQDELHEIDSLRSSGAFVFLDEQNRRSDIPQGQAQLHTLLHQCYRLVHQLVETQENNVDEKLKPIEYQLQDVKRGLERLQNQKECKIDDVIPYQDRLREIDSLREGGAFRVPGGEIPPGQAILHEMLASCYSICRALIIKTETK